jgi:8-oxo-dGTP diphosphatase
MKHLVETTVGAIIIKEEPEGQKILLTKRGFPPFQGKWCLPGGHIDPGEPAKQAIIREVKEEVGLDFEARFFSYFDEIIPEQEIHAVVLIFTGTATGEPKPQPGEVTGIQWFLPSEALTLSLAFQHDQILKYYQKTIDKKLPVE